MRTVRVVAAARIVGCAFVLTLGVASCRLNTPAQTDSRPMSLPYQRQSALMLIVDPASPGALVRIRNLLASTARPGEHLVLLSMASGALLASASTPVAAAVRVPDNPAPIPHDATAFQRARYRRALADHKATVARVRTAMYRSEEQLLDAWAASIVARIVRANAPQPVTRDGGIVVAFNAAVAGLSSLQQAGVSLGARKVIAILGLHGASFATALGIRAGLRGTTVVVAAFPDSGDDEAAWQASLLQAGASRGVILTPATDDQLPAVVNESLDGAVTVPLTDALFAPSSYKLSKTAVRALDYVLRLLTYRYPQATATIDGYTDNLAIPGGNLKLSRERAEAVQAWLIAHGIAPSRLQANGYGDTDPVAPNQTHGQPLNRRVLIVIDPVVQAPDQT